MKFELYKDVILTKDLPEEGLKAGDIGTVVEHHTLPGHEDGYSVEFFDMAGETVAVVTVGESYIRKPSRTDRPAVRAMVASGS